MKNLKFSLQDIYLFQDDEDDDFALAKVKFLRSGNNSHHNPISVEVLKRDAHTALGKFIIGKFDKWIGDVRGHNNDQIILGYIPPNSTIEFEVDGDDVWAVADAVVSKIYATDVYKLFQKDNIRSVSSEFSACLEFDEEDIKQGVDNPILSFKIHGVTILGKTIKPSCTGADIKIIKFSEQQASEYYDSHNNLSRVYAFAEERRQRVTEKTYKINKTELKETPWGNVNKTNMRNKIMQATNKESLVKTVYALVEAGWEEAPSEHLKYPLMQLIGDTFYYNRYALSSALAYAKQENETGVIKKVEKLYNKFNLNENDKEGEKKMEQKEFSVADIGVPMSDESVVKDETVTFAELDNVEKVVGFESEDISVKDNDEDDDIKDNDGHDDNHDSEKQMSLDANVDVSAYLAMLENETEQYKTLGKRILDDPNRGLVMQEVLTMAKEYDILCQFKKEKDRELQELKVNQILMEAKEDLTDKEFEDLKVDGMACQYEEMTSFENKVKAMAYANAKKKPQGQNQESTKQFARMDFNFDKYLNGEHSTINADDIYNKYL